MNQKDLNQLTNAYADLSHAIRSRVEEYARLRWRGLPDYYASSIDAFVEDLVPRVQVAQEKLALLTDQYLANAHELLGYAPPSGELITEEINEGLRGAPAEVVYRRPANEVYAALHEQKTLEEAKRAGELRLLSIIGSDMQQARIRQAQRSMSSAGSGGGPGSGDDGPQYYRRVLTGRENCALCIVASTQRYKVSEVLPVHPGCDCGFQPLAKGQDLFHVLDPELLERVHQIVEERTGESNRSAGGYGDFLMTLDHTEHGHILKWKHSKAKPYREKTSKKSRRQDEKHFKRKQILDDDAYPFPVFSRKHFKTFIEKTVYGAFNKQGKPVGGHTLQHLNRTRNKVTIFPELMSEGDISRCLKMCMESPDVRLRGNIANTVEHEKIINASQINSDWSGDITVILRYDVDDSGSSTPFTFYPLAGTIKTKEGKEFHVLLWKDQQIIEIPKDGYFPGTKRGSV